MSHRPMMIRVSPADIVEDEPVPYSVFTIQGALLCAEGDAVPVAEQAEILRRQGWRRVRDPSGGEPACHEADTELPEIDLSPEACVRLPVRGHPVVAEADVLVVDDLKLARNLLTHMLRTQGVKHVESVDNGFEAISYFFRERPHLLFLDIDMPALNGLEALKQIKHWSPDSFVCIVSGKCTMSDVKQAKSLGVDAILVKPYSLGNLDNILRHYSPTEPGNARKVKKPKMVCERVGWPLSY